MPAARQPAALDTDRGAAPFLPQLCGAVPLRRSAILAQLAARPRRTLAAPCAGTLSGAGRVAPPSVFGVDELPAGPLARGIQGGSMPGDQAPGTGNRQQPADFDIVGGPHRGIRTGTGGQASDQPVSTMASGTSTPAFARAPTARARAARSAAPDGRPYPSATGRSSPEHPRAQALSLGRRDDGQPLVAGARQCRAAVHSLRDAVRTPAEPLSSRWDLFTALLRFAIPPVY